MQEQISQQSTKTLNDWLLAYGESWIAHAVWPNNVDLLVRTGRLRSAEDILRTTGKVSYEKGDCHDQRGTLDITKTLEYYRAKPPKVSYQIEILNDMPLKEACKQGFLDIAQILSLMSLDEAAELELFTYRQLKANMIPGYEEDQSPLNKEAFASLSEEEKQSYFVKLKDGKNYPIILTPDSPTEDIDKYTFKIKGLPALKCHLPRGIALEATQVATDCVALEPIDKKLAKVWNSYNEYTTFTEVKKRIEFLCELLTYRQREILPTKLSIEIWAVYCSIKWNYGSVVILRGNPENIISLVNFENKSNIVLERLQAVQLLMPFENNGEFFSLDLKQEDTIVIGPAAILDPYRDLDECQGIQFFDFESMNEQQLEFFRVPSNLRPKKLEPEKEIKITEYLVYNFFSERSKAELRNTKTEYAIISGDFEKISCLQKQN